MNEAMRRLADLPDDPPARKKRRVQAADIVAVVNAVSKGMPCESAVNILVELGLDDAAARKMCDPAKASYEGASKPVAPIHHVHIPKESIRVDVTQAAPPAAAPPVVNVAPAQVIMPPEREPKAFVHKVFRNNQGRIERIVSTEAE